jgi:predicted metal-dependent phosphoesterase TrpH
VVDLYGRNGFDVLAITDHVVRTDDPWRAPTGWAAVQLTEESWPRYLAEVEREAERAWTTYGLLVVPGAELTYNDSHPERAAHAVAIGLRRFVSVDAGIAEAVTSAAEAGAALVAAHPYDRTSPADGVVSRLTQRFAVDEALRGLVHRFELFNRTDLYGWVARTGLPAIATGDFHVPAHLDGWKTLVPAARTEAAVVEYLRSTRPVYLARLGAHETAAAA